MKTYKLIGPDGKLFYSKKKGILGGYCRGKQKIYGRLNCPSALRWIAKGYYVSYRVFFASKEDALAAGFRACKVCKP
jgi:methylphosphotriester-DNA--protein-cysteine methyltransferase